MNERLCRNCGRPREIALRTGCACIPSWLWELPEARQAVQGKDVDSLIRLVRRHTDLSQHALARMAGVSQPMISSIISHKQGLKNIYRIDQALEGLGAYSGPSPRSAAESALLASSKYPQASTSSTEPTDPGDSDVRRRQFLQHTVASAAALGLPPSNADSVGMESPSNRGVGPQDVDTIREATEFFQHLDQRRGGGYAMQTATTFLTEEVAPALKRASASNALRSNLFSAAGELVYVVGWSSFDANRHTPAQEYFHLALTLATEANDLALEGHILRAMAHQALDLNQHHQAAELAEASIHPNRYGAATPRERALLGVVHARSLAHTGDRAGATQALLRAEDDLVAAASSDEEPQRVWFFQEASLAHETARTLHTLGDLDGAQHQFHRSVLTRRTSRFGRTHAVTLGYLGDVQTQQGNIDAACATWTQALDAMQGVRSGRAHNTVTNMRRVVNTLRERGIPAAEDLYERLALTPGAVL